jgi:hypothetical protein
MKSETPSVAGTFLLALLSALLLTGCGDSGTEPKNELEPLVGVWEAQALVITEQSDPDRILDIIAEGGQFTLSILSTGHYSARLSLPLVGASTEAGTVTVSGNQFTITPTSPPGPSTTGTWSLEGGVLYLDGATEFDFDLDGTREAADVHFELYSIDS